MKILGCFVDSCHDLNVLDQLDDTVKEVRLQTERERQLELQLISIIRQLQDVTVQATEKQTKLEEERQQATEKIKSDQTVMTKHFPKQIFQCIEKAKHELDELKQLRKKEEQTICECQKACQRLLHRDILEGHDIGKKSQEDAAVRIEILNAHSQFEVSKYRNESRVMSESTVQDEAVRKAFDRENKLRHELSMSDKRRQKWQCDLKESSERMSAFGDEVRQSVARQKQFQSLTNASKTKAEQAKQIANYAQKAVHNELVSASSKEQVLQRDFSMSSDRIKKLKHELLQADKRQRWLDELESTCGKDSSAYEVFQQTSAERRLLKEQLQSGLQTEEELMQQLQQMHENKKLSKKRLEMASESLKNTQEMIDRTWRESEQMVQTCLISVNEEMLQKNLNDKELRLQEEIRQALSEEKKLQQKLRKMSEEEKLFHIPLTQLKYTQSGEYCYVFITIV